MTNQEIIDWQRKYREWSATPAGAVCERALRTAQAEGHNGNDERCSAKRAKESFEAARAAAGELRALLRAQQSDLAAAQARVKELEEAQTWRPIETAPKDGTVILGWPIYGHAGPREIQWRAWAIVDGQEECWIVCNSAKSKQEVTHWMPLPSPPALTGDER